MSDALDSINVADLVSALAPLEYREGELDNYLNGIAQAFSRLLGIDWTVVTLSLDLERYAVIGNSAPVNDLADDVLSLHGTVANTVLTSGEPLCVENRETCAGCGELPPGYVAYLGMPLKTPSGDTLGTLCSFHRTSRSFGPHEVGVAKMFAERVAAAIDNFRAYQELAKLNQNLEGVVRARTAELAAVQTRLIRQERLAAIGEFAAKIVHEVRTPLSTMVIALDYLANETLESRAERRVHLAAGESQRLQRLLSEILDYANPSSGPREKVNLAELLLEIVENYQAGLSRGVGAAVRLVCDDTNIRVLANRDKLRQVFINLLDNALDAAPADGIVDIEVILEGDQQTVRVDVRNPIAGENFDVARMCEPFYSTKSSGTGLGLSIVEGILESLEGRFDITRPKEGEVLAQVSLPAVEPVPDADIANESLGDIRSA